MLYCEVYFYPLLFMEISFYVVVSSDLHKTKQWLKLFKNTSSSFYFAVFSFLLSVTSFLSLKVAYILTVHDVNLNFQNEICLPMYIILWYLLPLVYLAPLFFFFFFSQIIYHILCFLPSRVPLNLGFSTYLALYWVLCNPWGRPWEQLVLGHCKNFSFVCELLHWLFFSASVTWQCRIF